jgi:UDP-N-acetylmuramoylalanine--D-glutamate ligase
MNPDYLKNKKILILGFGREGQDTYFFIRKLWPDKVLGIADKQEISNFKFLISKKLKNDKKVVFYFGKNYLENLKDYDVVIKTPGIPIHLQEIEKAFKQGKITSQTEIFLQNCPGTIIGITGTKGKSTTTSLIYEILKSGGLKAHLVGNIGNPVLGLLKTATKKDIYVFELSCHQLYGIKKSPHIAVFLNVYPEHLDYYKNIKEYARAKANITLHQTKDDFLIYNPKNKIVDGLVKESKAKKISFSNYHEIIKNIGINKPESLKLRGEHNLFNIAAAIKAGELFKIPKEKIKKTIVNFKPLEHRSELVGTYRGITFYNDALSTIPETAIAALDALGDRVETIFLGGYDRNIKFDKLAKRILKSKIKNIVFFPTTGKLIWNEIKKTKNSGRFKTFFTDNMKDAVEFAYANTGRWKICLMSCASTSFSIFKDYREKGDLFKKEVKSNAN